MTNEAPKHIRLMYEWFLKRNWTVDDALEYFENIDFWQWPEFFDPHREGLNTLKEYRND